MGAFRKVSQSTQIAVGQREDGSPHAVRLVVLRLVPVGQEYREGDVRVRAEGDRDQRGKACVHAVGMPDEAIENGITSACETAGSTYLIEQIASDVVVAPEVTTASPFAGQGSCVLPPKVVGL